MGEERRTGDSSLSVEYTVLRKLDASFVSKENFGRLPAEDLRLLGREGVCISAFAPRWPQRLALFGVVNGPLNFIPRDGVEEGSKGSSRLSRKETGPGVL